MKINGSSILQKTCLSFLLLKVTSKATACREEERKTEVQMGLI